jgi:hypothetical protein
MTSVHQPAFALFTILGLAWLCPTVSTAQTFTVLSNPDFGLTEFAGSTATANLTMGTDGSVTYAGNLAGSGIGTGGQVRIDATTGDVVTIACSSSATLARVGQDPLPLNPVRVSLGGTASYSGASTCSGVGTTVFTHTISSSPSANIVYFGGRLLTSGLTLSNGDYSTANGGGTPVTLRVIIQ